MNRSRYLAQRDVQQFIEWLVPNLTDDGNLSHCFVERRSGRQLQFAGLEDAFEQYRWPSRGAFGIPAGETLADNDQVLRTLRDALRKALDRGDAQATCSAACQVMVWGGVQNGNIRWLQENAESLADTLEAVTAALDAGELAGVLLDTQLRFNAGMTKVYSLLAKDLIIYDSRVAAALGWLVAKYCRAQALAAVPAPLAFPWAPAKEGLSAASPKNRNPAIGGLRFPRLQSGPMHAEWNLKASWVLVEALSRDRGSRFAQPGPVDSLRRLEAALFMLGYDLPPQPLARQVVAQGPLTQASSAEASTSTWNECYTAARGKQFHYRIEPDRIVLKDGRVFLREHVNATLEWLKKHFRSNPFPLANSAQHVPTGASPAGIGVAYFRATLGKGSPPHTSALAAVLVELGILLRQSHRSWVLSPECLAAGTIDIGPVLQEALDLAEAL